MKRNASIRFIVVSLVIVICIIVMVGLFRPNYVRGLLLSEPTPNDLPVMTGDSNQAPVVSTGASVHTLAIAGQKRTYTTYVPPRVTARQTPIDILIVFHGTGGSGEGIRDVGFDSYTDRGDFIVVYPDSLVRDGVSKWDPTNRQIKDIDFIKALISEMADFSPSGVGNVYVAGMSNGSVMAQTVGCLIAGIDGVAAVSAGMGSEMLPYCNLVNPIPYIGFYGTLDRFGEIKKYEASVAHFAQQNGCTDSYTVTAMPATDPDDGTTVERRIYQASNGQACETPVHYYRIEDGGHFWPGAKNYREDRLERNTGFVSQDIDATKLIVEFFGLVK